jgi:hypothetical protein
MDRRHQTDRQQEGTAKPTGNARNAGPRPWELEKYIYKESSTDDERSSYSDPRLELARHTHDLHQDRDFIPHDGDPEQIHTAFGLGATPDLHARDPSASDQGTLAGSLLHIFDPPNRHVAHNKKIKWPKSKPRDIGPPKKFNDGRNQLAEGYNPFRKRK